MGGGLVVVVLVAWVGLRAVAHAEPPALKANIVCDPTCVVVAEPPIGHPVSITIEAHADSPVILLHDKPCPAPCRTNWPGSDALAIRVGPAKNWITVPVAAGPAVRSVDEAPAVEPALQKAQSKKNNKSEIKVIGDVTTVPVPSEAEPSIDVIDGDPVGVSAGASDAVASLDEYFGDVVLLSGSGLTCTAIAVGPRHVLTAGHCATATHVHIQRTALDADVFAVERARLHPRSELDVAVLVTKADLRVPVRPRASGASDSAAGGLAKLIGFGTNERTGEHGSGVKRQATISVGDWRCTSRRAHQTGCVPELELVIGASTSDTCTGDSGGPVLDRIAGRWRLAGVTSRAVPSPRGVCGGGGIYTSVGAIAGWITEQVQAP